MSKSREIALGERYLIQKYIESEADRILKEKSAIYSVFEKETISMMLRQLSREIGKEKHLK